MKRLSLHTLLILFTLIQLHAAPGDTTIIQTFSFDEGRQANWEYKKGVFAFPSGEVQYEKVWMIYTLKCDNRLYPACGEWDYIVNTVLKERTGEYKDGEEIIRDWQLAEYITPYGFGINLHDGWTWIYDVSDFVHLLKDSVEIWEQNFQEMIDLKFMFIEGTPPRDVIDIQTIWAGRYYVNVFDSLIRDTTMMLPPGTKQVKLRTTVTGHDFSNPTYCAEFCPNMHSVTANGEEIARWQIIQECATNPLYPQGGTWIFDRAGWCTGTKATTNEFELTPYIKNNSITFDYNVEFDSNGYYFTHIELVCYGDYNFEADVRAEEILAPTHNPQHGRYNPTCAEPVITVRNIGKEHLTSLVVHYTFSGGKSYSYTWTGNIPPMQMDTITLPTPDWNSVDKSNGLATFQVQLLYPNGKIDPTPHNNTITSLFELPMVSHIRQFCVALETNHAAGETSWEITDLWKNVLYSNPDSLLPNTSYKTFLTLKDGCYKFHVKDTSDNGLRFWFNMPPHSDGTAGRINLKRLNSTGIEYNFFHSINPNFGKENTFYFAVNRFHDLSSNNSNADLKLNVHPLPASDFLYVETTKYNTSSIQATIYDLAGKPVQTTTIQGNSLAQISIGDLAAGSYLLVCTDGEAVLGRANFGVAKIAQEQVELPVKKGRR